MSNIIPFRKTPISIKSAFDLMFSDLSDNDKNQFTLVAPPDASDDGFGVMYCDRLLLTLSIVQPAQVDAYVDGLDFDYDVVLAGEMETYWEIADNTNQLLVRTSALFTDIVYRKRGVFYMDVIRYLEGILNKLTSVLTFYTSSALNPGLLNVVTYHNEEYVELTTTPNQLLRFADSMHETLNSNVADPVTAIRNLAALNVASLSAIQQRYCAIIEPIQMFHRVYGGDASILVRWESPTPGIETVFDDLQFVLIRSVEDEQEYECVYSKRLSEVKVNTRIARARLLLQNLLALTVRYINDSNDALFSIPFEKTLFECKPFCSLNFMFVFNNYRLVDIVYLDTELLPLTAPLLKENSNA